MRFNMPMAVAKAPGEARCLWRRLFMEALETPVPSAENISHALYSVATLSGAPLVCVVDALVDLGLRANLEAMPKPWLAVMKGRVLDLEERAVLSWGQASLAASWGWMPPPAPRFSLPPEICAETDPFGADLLSIFGTELGAAPQFGYTPAALRLALLRTALGMGRPLAEVVSLLVSRGMVLPPEALPAPCRETLRVMATHPLVEEQVASWQVSQQVMAEIIPLRRAQK